MLAADGFAPRSWGSTGSGCRAGPRFLLRTPRASRAKQAASFGACGAIEPDRRPKSDYWPLNWQNTRHLRREELSLQIAPVWDRVLAVAVDDPGIWHRAAGLVGRVGLCDSSRLAELSGLNVIDDFAARDVTLDGAGRPLEPIPNWLLLHDAQRTRVLVQLGRRVRHTYLPGSRDPDAASRVLHIAWRENRDSAPSGPSIADAIVRRMATHFPQFPAIDELVIAGPEVTKSAVTVELATRLPTVRLLDTTLFGIVPGALKSSAIALLGLLHLDRIPANSSAITGARTPRVLGRLTPGSAANWHRLLGELARARPSVVALRSAV